MNLRLRTTSRAKRDFWKCHDYIAQRSPEGAARWVNAYEAAAQSLLENPNRGLAPESERHDAEIRQRFFKTP